MKMINDGRHNRPVPSNEFYLAVGDVIARGRNRYRVDRINLVSDGPDAGYRDVLTVTPVYEVTEQRTVWHPLPFEDEVLGDTSVSREGR